MQRVQYDSVPVQEAHIVHPSGQGQHGAQKQVVEEWMSIPLIQTPNCPPGLEYLTAIDQLLINQADNIFEAFAGYDQKKKYKIKNALGQNVYFAAEQSDCMTRFTLGALRPFDMQILDNFQNGVMHFYRQLRCTGCCFPCCLQKLEVSSPPGTLIGTVEEEWSFLVKAFVIKNAIGDPVLRIKGPICAIKCFNDVDFEVLTMNGNKIGKISKQWSGLAREIFTDTDYFGVTFPLDLDVRMKALVLAATFLIDMIYFEH